MTLPKRRRRWCARAEDRRSGDGAAIGHEVTRKAIDERLSGAPRTLQLYADMLVVLTVNRQRIHRGFVNGALGRVVDARTDGAGAVVEVRVRLVDEAEVVRVKREDFRTRTYGEDFVRTMLPMLPAHAMTVHRVQGATLSGPVHILLNKEFFAEGQAYVALSRLTHISQLHLWALEREAIVACPAASAEYERMRARGELGHAHVAAAPPRQRVQVLLPLAAP